MVFSAPSPPVAIAMCMTGLALATQLIAVAPNNFWIEAELQDGTYVYQGLWTSCVGTLRCSAVHTVVDTDSMKFLTAVRVLTLLTALCHASGLILTAISCFPESKQTCKHLTLGTCVAECLAMLTLTLSLAVYGYGSHRFLATYEVKQTYPPHLSSSSLASCVFTVLACFILVTFLVRVVSAQAEEERSQARQEGSHSRQEGSHVRQEGSHTRSASSQDFRLWFSGTR